MKNLYLVFLIATFLFSCKSEPYNVLFIAVDDLRPELGCYGVDEIKSPNIDQLASEGTLFERAYCNIPVCGASRSSLLSGLRATRNRYLHYYSWAEKENPGVVNLPGHYKNNGYYTASFGKVYHHQKDNIEVWDTIWDHMGITGWTDYLTEENIERHAQTGKSGLPFEHPDVHDTMYRDGKIAQKAISSLKVIKNQDKPFFMAVGFLKPHLPFNAPKKYWDMYNPDEIEVPVAGFKPTNAPGEAFHNSGELRAYGEIPPQGPVSEEMARKLIHGYRACVSYTDAQIGAVLSELKKLGLDKNTIVVLWGDHGWNLREHGMWCKHCNFETSLHVPLIIKMPGQKPIHTSEIVEFVDIYPTLCELTGLELPLYLEGKSMAPLMKNPNAKSDGVAISKWFDGVTTITKDYFYTEWITNNDSVYARMLYDHNSDPVEMNNLAEKEEYTFIMDSLAQIQRSHRGSNFWAPALVSEEELKH